MNRAAHFINITVSILNGCRAINRAAVNRSSCNTEAGQRPMPSGLQCLWCTDAGTWFRHSTERESRLPACHAKADFRRHTCRTSGNVRMPPATGGGELRLWRPLLARRVVSVSYVVICIFNRRTDGSRTPHTAGCKTEKIYAHLLSFRANISTQH
jgi:hypothetical protein